MIKICVFSICLILISCQQNQNSKDNGINTKIVNDNKLIKKNIIDSNSIKAFDKIYFGKINPYVKSEDEYFKFLWDYESEIAGVLFYYWPPSERRNSNYGLYKFGLATTEAYSLIEAKKINADLKLIIAIKYPNAKKIDFSDKESMEKINSEFNKNISGHKAKIHQLNTGYNVYENLWNKDNIEIQQGYIVEFNWVDKDNNILKLDGIDIRSKIQSQKKTYRPFLKFSNVNVINKIEFDNKKEVKEARKNDENKF